MKVSRENKVLLIKLLSIKSAVNEKGPDQGPEKSLFFN